MGTALGCPHCHHPVHLPDTSPVADEALERESPRTWLQNSLSTIASVVFHAGLLFLLALISYGKTGIPNEGEEISIGTLPEVVLEDSPQELDAKSAESEPAETDLEMSLELEAPMSLAGDVDHSNAMELVPSVASGGGEFDLGTVSIGGQMAGGGSWEGMLSNLRRNGLDIVIAFDSTSSMGGEINVVKAQIERIAKTMLKLVPKARISLCTYRDRGDAYVVRGIPLTNEVDRLRAFLYEVRAGGGGDAPEAVDAGLDWAIVNNDFRTRARKVILIFGDAPPHRSKLAPCLRMASDFAQTDGVVSTVTCRRRSIMTEFREIAAVGGGEAFMTTDEKQIVSQLVVLVFGARHRAKVLEAFDMLEGR